MKSLCLSPSELFDLTKKQKYSAQAKVLRAMGIDFIPRPDGSIAVDREYYESLISGEAGRSSNRMREKTQPRWDAA
jgi:hypothetical protein